MAKTIVILAALIYCATARTVELQDALTKDAKLDKVARATHYTPTLTKDDKLDRVARGLYTAPLTKDAKLDRVARAPPLVRKFDDDDDDDDVHGYGSDHHFGAVEHGYDKEHFGAEAFNQHDAQRDKVLHETVKETHHTVEKTKFQTEAEQEHDSQFAATAYGRDKGTFGAYHGY